MKPRFLVTGGGGFIGTWVLKEILDRGGSAVVYDAVDSQDRWRRIIGERASEIAYVAGDILNLADLHRAMDDHQVTHVIHLAGLLTPACQQDPCRGCEVNVLGTMRVFEAIRASAGRVRGFVYASSIGVYGRDIEEGGGTPDEAGTLEPETFYGSFKRACEMIAQQY